MHRRLRPRPALRRLAAMTFPWPDSPPTDAQRAAFADAVVRPYWLDALPAAGSLAPARRTGGGRPLHRRRRLHRALGGSAREGRRPRPRRRRARGGHGRLRRERAQRRLRARVADPRDRERPRALRGRDRRARAARPRELRGLPRRPRAPRHRLRRRADRRHRRRARAARARLDPGGGRALRALRPRVRGLRPGGRSAPRSRRRRTWAASGPRPTRPSSTRGSSAPASPRPRSPPASASTSARARRRSSTTAPGVRVLTPTGHVRARRVLLATSAYPPLLRAIRRYVAPVYDYALMTEPLSPAQRDAIGWKRRQGLSDMANQFHYYRLTKDERILFGGYDAVYRYGGPVRADLDDDEQAFGMLSQHFFTTFPQLEGASLHAPLGRRDRHVQPVRRLLRDGPSRPRRLRGRVHGARRRLDALRRARRARPSRRAGDRGDAAALRPLEARSLPARADALGRDPAHAQPPGRRRPQRRAPRALAADARPAGARVRQLAKDFRRGDVRRVLRSSRGKELGVSRSSGSDGAGGSRWRRSLSPPRAAGTTRCVRRRGSRRRARPKPCGLDRAGPEPVPTDGGTPGPGRADAQGHPGRGEGARDYDALEAGDRPRGVPLRRRVRRRPCAGLARPGSGAARDDGGPARACPAPSRRRTRARSTSGRGSPRTPPGRR